MKRLFLLISLIFLFTSNNFAQISEGGKPFSFYPQNAGHLNPVVPTSTMPFVDVAALEEEDVVVDKIKEIPWRFGQNIDVILNRDNSGITEILPNGDKLWRLRIYSPGAQSINLTFDSYHLPAGAKLFIYNDLHSDVTGAFTDFNNQDNRVFATTLLRGDAVTLEYYEPANVAFPGELNINRVTHGYRGPFEYVKGLNTSGSCQVNVKCPTGIGWEDQNNAACMLVIGGNGFCSGAMVNNTANDFTPYVLTANHCSTSNDFASWVFWFKWESPTCTNPTTSPTYKSISGSTLKARDPGSDFCLVQMSSAPPVSYNIYYAGWDRSGTPATSGMSIHHPDGDITKISPCGAMTTASYNAAQCWQTPWTGAACTEPGSSGSPIFDQNKRIVGQLFGGPSACGSSSMWDYYGCFHISWTGAGTSSTRLSNWLDPGNTGATSLNGMYQGGSTTVTANFLGTPLTIPVGGTVNFTDLSTGSPTAWSWTFTGGTPSSSTTQNPTSIQYNTAGTYPVSLTVTGASGTDTETKNNYIYVGTDPGNSICDTLHYPLYGNMVMYSIRYSNGVYGYVSGNNGNSDKAKADFFVPSSPYIKLIGVYFKFGKVKKASSHTYKVPVKVWNNSGPGGAPGSVLLTDSIPFLQIFDDINHNRNTFLQFPTPLNITSSFYLGVELPMPAGDTLVLMTNKNGESIPGTAWEQWRDGTWYAYTNAISWNYNLSHAIFPVICKQDYSIEEPAPDDIFIYPNPASQQFTISFGSIAKENVSVKIFNSLGAMVKEKETVINGSTSSPLTIDMNDCSSGIYFVSVSFGNQRIIRKLSLVK